MPAWVVARRVTSNRWPTEDRRPGDTIPLEQPSMPRGYERGMWAAMVGTTVCCWRCWPTRSDGTPPSGLGRQALAARHSASSILAGRGALPRGARRGHRALDGAVSLGLDRRWPQPPDRRVGCRNRSETAVKLAAWMLGEVVVGRPPRPDSKEDDMGNDTAPAAAGQDFSAPCGARTEGRLEFSHERPHIQATRRTRCTTSAERQGG